MARLSTFHRYPLLVPRQPVYPKTVAPKYGQQFQRGPTQTRVSVSWDRPLGRPEREAVDSRVRNPVSSPIALINGAAGKTMVVFSSTPGLGQGLQFLRSCDGSAVVHIGVSDASPSAAAAHALPFGGNDFGPLSRSAWASRAIAGFMLSGSWMSSSSAGLLPHPTPRW